jgi:hypothetical protein
MGVVWGWFFVVGKHLDGKRKPLFEDYLLKAAWGRMVGYFG